MSQQLLKQAAEVVRLRAALEEIRESAQYRDECSIASMAEAALHHLPAAAGEAVSGCMAHGGSPAFGCSACDARTRPAPTAAALDHWQEARERDIRELREQVRCLQLTTQRLEAALKTKEKP